MALFTTCYCNVNTPGVGEDLIKVFEHNGIPVRLTAKEECCGMPKLEQGDLETVEKRLHKRLRSAHPDSLVPPEDFAGQLKVKSEIYLPELERPVVQRVELGEHVDQALAQLPDVVA